MLGFSFVSYSFKSFRFFFFFLLCMLWIIFLFFSGLCFTHFLTQPFILVHRCLPQSSLTHVTQGVFFSKWKVMKLAHVSCSQFDNWCLMIWNIICVQKFHNVSFYIHIFTITSEVSLVLSWWGIFIFLITLKIQVSNQPWKAVNQCSVFVSPNDQKASDCAACCHFQTRPIFVYNSLLLVQRLFMSGLSSGWAS